MCDIMVLIHWPQSPLRKLLYIRNWYLIERALLQNRTSVTYSHGNSFYFSLCLIVLYQGEPGPKGEKGDSGTSGEPVSAAKCFFSWFWTLAVRGQKSCLSWRERGGHALSIVGMLLSSEMATVVLGFVLTVEEATWVHEFKHLIYSSGP